MSNEQAMQLGWPPKMNRLSTQECLRIVSTLEQEASEWVVGPVVDEARQAIQRLLAERDFLVVQLSWLLRAHGYKAEASILERGR